MAEIEDDLDEVLFGKISAYVYKACGINLTPNKFELVRARLGKEIRAHGFRSYREYYKYMVQDTTGEALAQVLNAVSTNLTSFYRESKHFDFLAQTLIPDLAAQAARSSTYHLRGWSAGCSTGAEVYTIAITLAAHLPDLPRWDCRLLATDIDTNVLSIGKRGSYPQKVIEPVPRPILQKYFTPSPDKTEYQVCQALRNLVQFRFLNLMHPFPFRGRFDFIFCRNVMIYFDRPTQEALVAKYHEVLKPGGHLFIGHSEGLSGIRHEFTYVQPTIYRKR